MENKTQTQATQQQPTPTTNSTKFVSQQPQQNSPYSLINIKIHFNDCSYNWNVNFTELNFNRAINHIANVTSNNAISSFEYIDEDGDRIIVKSDDEMRSLLKSYLTYFKNCLLNRRIAEPLSIFPKTQSKNKNFKGLKLSASNESCNNSNNPTPMSSKNTNDFISNNNNNNSTKSNENTFKENINHNLDELISSQRINPNELNNLGIIGQGHGGIVYKCFHNVLQKYMALKIRSIDASKESKKQIISELEILYQCNSPFVITYYGSFFHDSRIAMCTEFMDFGSLDLYKCVPQEVLARISVAIVKGLIYLCNLKILHRDLKPSNVLLNSLGQVKLCDFGDGTQMIRSLTCSYVGTNAYMSPERIQGEQYGVESDVWSLGLTLLETGLGKYPYENKTNSNTTSPTVKVKPIELLQCIMYEEPPKLPTDRYSESFNNFISLCLQKNPVNRPKPNGLMNHEIIQKYDDGCINIISAYLKQTNPTLLTN